MGELNTEDCSLLVFKNEATLRAYSTVPES